MTVTIPLITILQRLTRAAVLLSGSCFKYFSDWGTSIVQQFRVLKLVKYQLAGASVLVILSSASTESIMVRRLKQAGV